MTYRTEALDLFIKSKYGTRRNFAVASGIDETALSKAFKRGKFTTDQIAQISKALKLSPDEVMVYFFTPTGDKRQHKEAKK